MKKAITNTMKNAGKVAVALVGAILVGETAFAATSATEYDVEKAGEFAHYLTNPDPYKVKEKTGKMPWKKKTSVVKQNPVTGKIHPYTGKKKPVNDKAIKLY